MTDRTLKAWLEERRRPSNANLERTEAAYRQVRRQNVARHLLRRLNAAGGTRVEAHPLNQSQVPRPLQRVVEYRAMNVRRWHRIAEAWAAGDHQPVSAPGSWSSASLCPPPLLGLRGSRRPCRGSYGAQARPRAGRGRGVAVSGPGGISDLDKNRALVEWLEWQLRKARNRVRELEVQEEQERRRREQAHAALRWKIRPQRSSSAALVHRGDCALYPVEGGFLTREEIMIAEETMIALAEPDIEACQICKPETGLVDG